MFRILLPIDSDKDRGLAAVAAVISLPNGTETIQVTILNIEEKMDAADDMGTVNSENWYDKENFPSSCIRVKEKLESEGISVEMQREHGDPKEAIIAAANDIDADRIIMSGRKRTPTGKALFGSVTQSVLLNSDIPVTVLME